MMTQEELDKLAAKARLARDSLIAPRAYIAGQNERITHQPYYAVGNQVNAGIHAAYGHLEELISSLENDEMEDDE